jgi:hypothetical protein
MRGLWKTREVLRTALFPSQSSLETFQSNPISETVPPRRMALLTGPFVNWVPRVKQTRGTGTRPQRLGSALVDRKGSCRRSARGDDRAVGTRRSDPAEVSQRAQVTPQEERSPQPRVMVTTPRTISNGATTTVTAAVDPVIARAAIAAPAITANAATNCQPVSLVDGAAGGGTAGAETAGSATGGEATGLSSRASSRTFTGGSLRLCGPAAMERGLAHLRPEGVLNLPAALFPLVSGWQALHQPTVQRIASCKTQIAGPRSPSLERDAWIARSLHRSLAPTTEYPRRWHSSAATRPWPWR